MFDGRWRTSVDRATGPTGAFLRRTGISADHLTGLGLVMAAVTAVTIATGHLHLGLLLVVASAVPDLLDGAVAKASGTASPRGAFFDSVSDRVTDGLILGGIAWYLAGRDHGHAAVLPLAVLGASTLISYERAKAESLGFQAKGGLMERAERIIVLCFGLLVTSLLVPVLWVMLVLTAATGVQRFVKVWRQASVTLPARPERARHMATRWRSWRDATGERSSRSRRSSSPSAWRARRSDVGATRPWRRRAGTRP